MAGHFCTAGMAVGLPGDGGGEGGGSPGSGTAGGGAAQTNDGAGAPTQRAWEARGLTAVCSSIPGSERLTLAVVVPTATVAAATTVGAAVPVVGTRATFRCQWWRGKWFATPSATDAVLRSRVPANNGRNKR